ncbi:MAG: diguanylate cyclase (GGDEF)-like protein/PAS domain S-box-containing protein [Gammaproteobacteria bacterium]
MRSPQEILTNLARGYSQYWWLPTFIVLMLIPLSQSHFLLFHSLVELFAVVVAIISAIVAWHTYALAKNQFLLLLGCGYFFIGGLDLAHMLTFRGLPFLDNNTGNVSLQFWIFARFFEALLLLVAPLFINADFRPRNILIILSSITLLLCVAIMQNWLPVFYIEGKGLTLTKVILEYIIIILLLCALFTFWRARKEIEMSNLILINISIVLTIFAEYSFTLYSEFSDSMIILGHMLKLLSYWAIYVVLIESSLRQPFRSLARAANTYDAVPDETLVVDREGVVRQINQAVRRNLSDQVDAIGSRCHTLQHDPNITEQDCPICRCIITGEPLAHCEFLIERQQQWYEVILSPISHGVKSLGMVHVRRNITVAKDAQARSEIFNRLYTVLSHTNKAIADASSRQVMFTDICNIAVRYGGFKMAWVGLVHNEMIKPQVHAGDELGYLRTMAIRLDDSALARGPVGQAAKFNRVQCVNNIKYDPDCAPWSEAAEQRGYEALAAVPLSINNKVVGIYAIYSELPDAFDEKMLSLLDSLGRDIGTAMLRLQERQKREQVEAKIHQLSQVVEQNAHAILITDTHFKIEYANKAFTVLTGYRQQELINKTPAILHSHYASNDTYSDIIRTLKAGREWNGQVRNQRKDGTLYWALQSIIPIKSDDGEITHYVSTSEDNTDLHDAQQTIEQLAFYDPLTNLPNRRLLSDRLQQALEHAQRHPKEMVAVMVFDLDNFKTVNDSLGHNYGDDLLKYVAQIFRTQVRSEDTVSRQGGDEFTMILSGMKQIEKIADIATNILEKLSHPINLSGHQVVIGTSIGIAVYPNDAENHDELLRNADMAMYYAKEEGKNNFQFFMPSMNKQAHHRLLLENKLRNAIEEDHFQLFYQPQIDLKTGEIIGTEALIRWFDPEQGMIPPVEFIPLAEDTGLIGQIGDWVIEAACRDMKALQEKGFPQVKVAINVSAFQFRHGKHLTDVIRQSLEKYNFPAELFALELTESILIDDVKETLSILNSMRDLGITLAIDDFGTGYSSLSYLKQFPIDILKIDKSFIRDITTDASDKAIVSAIIAMAQQLDIRVLAEGVELIEQQAFLQGQGCDFVQGYLYCKPIPADELFERWQKKELTFK